MVNGARLGRGGALKGKKLFVHSPRFLGWNVHFVPFVHHYGTLLSLVAEGENGHLLSFAQEGVFAQKDRGISSWFTVPSS